MDPENVEDLDHFQKLISDQFSDLLPLHFSKESEHHAFPLPPSSASAAASDNDGDATPSFAAGEAFLSISWIRKLLDAFLSCEAEFKAVLLNGKDLSQIAKPPLDRWIPDVSERAVKALDICNAVTHGVEAIRFMQTQVQIVVSALEHRPFTDGQIRRARRALGAVLSSIVVDDKDSSGKTTERSWSFGRRGSGGASTKDRHHAPNFRSLSWSVAKNWSASKQIQAISSNFNTPRGGESSLALSVHIMGVVLVFVMWALVAAIPCQDRSGLTTHIPVPKNMGWAQSICGLQEKIAEEWKRKEKRGCSGILDEVAKVEKLAHSLVEFADNFQYPMEEEKEVEAAAKVAKLSEVCLRMEDGLGPLQRQIREVFNRLVKNRADVLELFDQASKHCNPSV